MRSGLWVPIVLLAQGLNTCQEMLDKLTNVGVMEEDLVPNFSKEFTDTPSAAVACSLEKATLRDNSEKDIEPMNQGSPGEQDEPPNTDSAAVELLDGVTSTNEILDREPSSKTNVNMAGVLNEKPCVMNNQGTEISGTKDSLDPNFTFEARGRPVQDQDVSSKIQKVVESEVRQTHDSNKHKLRRLDAPTLETTSDNHASIHTAPNAPPLFEAGPARIQDQGYVGFDRFGQPQILPAPARPAWVYPTLVPTYQSPTPIHVMTAEIEGPVAQIPVYKLNNPVIHEYWPNLSYDSWAHIPASANPMPPSVYDPRSNQVYEAPVMNRTPFVPVPQGILYDAPFISGHAIPAHTVLPDSWSLRSRSAELSLPTLFMTSRFDQWVRTDGYFSTNRNASWNHPWNPTSAASYSPQHSHRSKHGARAGRSSHKTEEVQLHGLSKASDKGLQKVSDGKDSVPCPEDAFQNKIQAFESHTTGGTSVQQQKTNDTEDFKKPPELGFTRDAIPSDDCPKVLFDSFDEFPPLDSNIVKTQNESVVVKNKSVLLLGDMSHKPEKDYRNQFRSSDNTFSKIKILRNQDDKSGAPMLDPSCDTHMEIHTPTDRVRKSSHIPSEEESHEKGEIHTVAYERASQRQPSSCSTSIKFETSSQNDPPLSVNGVPSSTISEGFVPASPQQHKIKKSDLELISTTKKLENNPSSEAMIQISSLPLKVTGKEPNPKVLDTFSDLGEVKNNISEANPNEEIALDEIVFATADQLPKRILSRKSQPRILKDRGTKSKVSSRKDVRIDTTPILQPQEYNLSSNRFHERLIKATSPIFSIYSMLQFDCTALVWFKSLISRTWSVGKRNTYFFRNYKEVFEESPQGPENMEIPPDNDTMGTMKEPPTPPDGGSTLNPQQENAIKAASKRQRKKNNSLGKYLENNRILKQNGQEEELSGEPSGIINQGTRPLVDSWTSQGLDVEFMNVLCGLMKIKVKNKLMRIDVTMEDYKTLGYSREFEKHKAFLWLKSHTQISSTEFARRRNVLKFQLQQYNIVEGWEKLKLQIDDEELRERVRNCFQIDRISPTYCDLDKTECELYEKYLEAITWNNMSVTGILEKLLGSEFLARRQLLRTMIQRQGQPIWWNPNDMMDARFQGLDVCELIHLGDSLNLGQNKFDNHFMLIPDIAQRTMRNIYKYIRFRSNRLTSYPLMPVSWDKSAEKAWFINHPQLHTLWKSRMKMIILGCNSYKFGPDMYELKVLGYSRTPWWCLGDLLRWTDDGIPIHIVNEIGIKLNLQHTAQITPELYKSANLNALLKDLNHVLSEQIREYFEDMGSWNRQTIEYRSSQGIWNHLKRKVVRLSQMSWKIQP